MHLSDGESHITSIMKVLDQLLKNLFMCPQLYIHLNHYVKHTSIILITALDLIHFKCYERSFNKIFKSGGVNKPVALTA